MNEKVKFDDVIVPDDYFQSYRYEEDLERFVLIFRPPETFAEFSVKHLEVSLPVWALRRMAEHLDASGETD